MARRIILIIGVCALVCAGIVIFRIMTDQRFTSLYEQEPIVVKQSSNVEVPVAFDVVETKDVRKRRPNNIDSGQQSYLEELKSGSISLRQRKEIEDALKKNNEFEKSPSLEDVRRLKKESGVIF